MSRPYLQRARARAAEQTRRDILEAARAELLAEDRLEFNVGNVAATAGVARSTVYAAFGSRPGLLSALANETLGRAGLEAVIDAYRQPDPLEALERSLAASCRMYAAEHPALRRLHVLALTDPDAAGPLRRSHGDRAIGLADLARRLAEAGRLAPGLTVGEAADRLWLLSGFWAYDELASGRGRSPEACARTIIAMARDTLLADG
jgi:AcrR family transcriptional regulator